jgi:hypothetical protein
MIFSEKPVPTFRDQLRNETLKRPRASADLSVSPTPSSSQAGVAITKARGSDPKLRAAGLYDAIQ